MSPYGRTQPRACAGIVAAALLGLGSGCARPQHPWLVGGNGWLVELDVSGWPIVEPDRYDWVAPELIAEAAGRLADRDFAPLSRDEAAHLAPELSPPADPLLQPFLLRGVAHGGLPTYALLRLHPRTGQVIVFQATYDGENFLGRLALSDLQSMPLVAYLPCSPSQVLATAVLGGDRILGGMGKETKWRGMAADRSLDAKQ